MNNKVLFILLVSIFFSTSMMITGCKKSEINPYTTGDVNIVGYLEKNIDSFSLFKQILDRTGNSAFLNAYGAYTIFAPTNSGVKTWLTKINAATVDAADMTKLQDMVKFHLLVDTITTSAFKDGKLPVPTMLGQFLVTGVGAKGGVSSYLVNRQAMISKSNIKVGNGIIHVIDNVLEPSTLTIAKQLEAKAEYSIFVQAMKETGYYDLLNTVDADTTKRWMTVIAESNKAFADSGITSYSMLKAKYSKTSNPSNTNDSLHMYMAYHILSGIKFLGDIITSPSHQTLQPQEVVSVQLKDQEVVLNEVEFNGVFEKGITVNRTSSDNAATNGVWHDAQAHFTLKFRKPTALFWEVTTFSEILKLPAYYKKQNYTWTRQSESDQPLKDIVWGWGPLAGTNTITYYYNSSSSNSITGYGAVNFDAIQMPMGLPNRPIWWELTTPPIIKGKYKVWICYIQRKQSSGSNELCQVSINGDVMPNTMNFTQTRPSGTDPELEAIGWKRYTESTNAIYAGRLVGVYDFKTTKRQTIRFTPLNGTQNDNYLDMIQFIPIDDQSQYLPRFKTDGTKIYQ
ncbi:fasciclin domain-containing protein [Chitinophagaceae bacterium LB-8]|uniref:Fasciclin domain-containing protein n=1 Tax=Paraflavisolibacter caeni TaxID=2982496 RepID=A0A9X3B8F2_9BACT|nr:fasciclin domain-containing protein [Paraflavisolibacter caeni]MCU7550655.1 fasciclin domain-containing protein [Paraflavisolibacter caeni]